MMNSRSGTASPSMAHSMFSVHGSTSPSPFLISTMSTKAMSEKHPVKVNKISSRFSKLPRHLKRNSLDYGAQKEVESLNFWQSAEDYECKSSLQELERAFKLKVSQNDQVEQQLRERKSKGRDMLLRRNSEATFQDKIWMRRFESRKKVEMFRERCRHTREYEEELADNFNRLYTQLKAKTNESDTLRSEMSEIRKALISLDLELKAFKAAFLKKEEIERDFRQKRQHSMAVFLSKKNLKKQEQEQKEAEYQTMQDQLRDRVRDLGYLILEVDLEISKIKSQVKLVREAQSKHFKDLLSEGIDSRSQGLEWIVRELWSFGLTVTDDMFPKYLDGSAIRAVLALAEKSTQIERVQRFINELMRKRNKRTSSLNRWNDIQGRLKGLSCNMTTKQPIVEFDKKSRTSMISWLHIDSADSSPAQYRDGENSRMPDILELEHDLEALRQEQQQIRDQELKRLTHECFINNYEAKFITDKKTLLASIVGVESIDRYLANIGKEQKLLSDKLVTTKTYKLGQ